MRTTKRSLSLAVAALFVLPAVGHAQAIDGAFVNGSLGRASFDFGAIDDSDTSYGVNVGYRWAVSPGALIGLEVGYIDFGNFSFPASITQITPIGTPPPDPATFTGSGTTELRGWTIGANGRFSLSPNWYIGGRVGYISASVDSRIRIALADDSVFRDDINDDAEGWYAGAGIGYDFSGNFSLGLNYDYYNSNYNGFSIDPDVVSVNGEFRF